MLRRSLAAMVLALAAQPALAQGSGPVRLVVGFPPGGARGGRRAGGRQRPFGTGNFPVGSRPAELREFVAKEIAGWCRMVRAAGLRIE